MLYSRKHLFDNKKIILASSSPRRKEILTAIGLPFEILASTFPEDLDKSTFPHPSAYVVENARIKASEVFQTVTSRDNGESPDLVIGSDTVVVLGGEILEKPKSRDHAVKMLTSLSGTHHVVYTGVAIQMRVKNGDGSSRVVNHSFFDQTKVTFSPLEPAAIEQYVETGDPMDKAGGYGIQNGARSFISSMEGAYDNVVGFPSNKFCLELIALLDTHWK